MEKHRMQFSTEVRAFGYVFAFLITLCTLPITAFHYWRNLEGFGLLAIGGLGLSDSVLWFAAHWATKAQSGIMKAVSLGVKFALAAVMICVAAVCLIVGRADREVYDLARMEQEGKVREIEARTKAAKELAGTAGGKGAAREIAKTEAGEGVLSIARTSRESLESRVPAWLVTWGIYTLPPLCALVGALILSIAAMIAGSREAESPSLQSGPAPHFKEDPPLPGNGYGAGKPGLVWQGGTARPQ